MVKLPVFTKGVQAFLNLKELITRLETNGCVIENLELMPITHEQCAKHYQKMVGGRYYDELQDLLDSCPSIVLEVSGDLDTILDLIGRKTDPKSCLKGTLRYKYGEHIGKNAYHRPETLEEVVTDEQNFWGENGFVAEYRDVQNEQLWQKTHDRAVAILKEYGADCNEFFAIVDKYRKVAGVLYVFGGRKQFRPFLKINFFSYLDNLISINIRQYSLFFVKQNFMFQLESKFKPAGDQPEAIKKIVDGFSNGKNIQTLLGATGTGKTFTMANIIQHLQKPTLVISHNKTLAAQLATELKAFFPHNAVHYFVSYFDYYQPESYLPATGTYIEKEATINQEIEMYRLATMASLLSRQDVIVVASASSLYGLGQKRFFQENCLVLEIGKSYDFKELKMQLLKMQYRPVHGKIEHGMFDFRGEILDIFTSTERYVYRCIFDDDKLERIEFRDSTTMKLIDENDDQIYYGGGHSHKVIVWPATQFIQDTSHLEDILVQMDAEKELRVKEFKDQKMLVEAERIKKRVEYDIRMIRETGFVTGIENYSLYFDRRLPGEPPNTLFDFFPDDMCLIIDESHMTLPQLQAMPQADRSRKMNLIKYGFRLPSAIDHRPLNYGELEMILGWKPALDKEDYIDVLNDASDTYKDLVHKSEKIAKARGENQLSVVLQKKKEKAKTLFLSATPASYEMNLSKQIVEQIIRPTGLLDPITYVYPKTVGYTELEKSFEELLKKKPRLNDFADGYSLKGNQREIFDE